MRRIPVKMAVVLLGVLSLLAPTTRQARAAGPQEGAAGGKVPLTHDRYDDWRSIRATKLSDDGAWMLYGEVPGDGDAELVVLNLTSGTEYRQPMGWLTATGARRIVVDARFTADSSAVVFLASADMASVKAARKAKKKPDEMPTKTLGILELAGGKVVTVDRVKSFALPDENGGWLAYLMEKAPEVDKAETEEPEAEVVAPEPEPSAEPAPAAEPEPAAEPAPAAAAEPEPAAEADDGEKKKEKKKDFGTELVVRDLATGTENRVDSVMQVLFADDGARLFYTVSSKENPETDGVYAWNTAAAAAQGLLTGEGNYKHATLNKDQTEFAVLSDQSDYAADEPVFELFGMAIGADAASLWVSHASTADFPAGFAVSANEPLAFTDDGRMVMFSIKEKPAVEDAAEDDEDGEETAKFDLWHWNDPYPQPQQLLMADAVNKEAFESVYHVADGRFVQLADADLPDVTMADNGSIAIGTTDKAWAKRASYEGFFDDVYLVDPSNGERTMVAERISSEPTLSPDGRYVAWFGGAGEWIGYDNSGAGGWSGGQHWFLHDVAAGTARNLSGSLDVPFERQDWDTTDQPRSYGNGGFSAGDGALLVYDEFDIWAFPTAGGEPRRMTEGVGREQNTSFRYLKLDPDEDAVPADQAVLLMGTNVRTMATGFWADRVDGTGTPTLLLGAEARLGFADVADNASTLVFTQQTFAQFPDVWTGQLQLGADLANDSDREASLSGVRKVTDLGSQTDPYVWGDAELRDFRSSDGLPLQGILLKPDNFDPDKQYPLMVYIYETLHQGLHSFRNPTPGTSINPSYYTSNGYILWMPDIEYVTPGYPGKDALKCVLPGINMLLSEGYIDEDAVGIQGHSWGGYQIAYMVTQTNIFKAAESGAPVSNMTSAYGGIRWGSGLVREFQYERTQSRLGASLWEVPLRYVENSPLFWADEIETPLLIMHNDNDGAVPWYQGIEFIMALRRLGKEAYMYNYNGEEHGLRKRVNQQDWTVRMQEFFDHHLRGEAAPEWMTEGIAGWQKGEVDR